MTERMGPTNRLRWVRRLWAAWWHPWGGPAAWLRDFRAGYDESDLRSGLAKIAANSGPGHLTWLTHREFEAVKSHDRGPPFKVDIGWIAFHKGDRWLYVQPSTGIERWVDDKGRDVPTEDQG